MEQLLSKRLVFFLFSFHLLSHRGTCDAIVAGTNLVGQLNTIVSRNIARKCIFTSKTFVQSICLALDSAVVTVGTFNAGYNANVISDLAKISGTLRSFEEPVMDILHQRIREICSGIEKSFNVQTEIKFADDRSYPVTRNTSLECVENVRRASSKIVSSDLVVEPISTMGAEDFSFFLNERPGCFFFVGSYPGKTDPSKPATFEYLDRPHHKSNFDLHEDALGVGASIWVQLIEDLLTKSGSQPPSPKRLKK
jgi:amidohydrolase